MFKVYTAKRIQQELQRKDTVQQSRFKDLILHETSALTDLHCLSHILSAKMS